MKAKQLTGYIKKVNTLNGTVKEIPALKGSIVKGLGPPAAPSYEGIYTVKPLPYEDTTLPTGGKTLKKDVKVLEIPYYTTTNLSGGYTAIIGE